MWPSCHHSGDHGRFLAVPEWVPRLVGRLGGVLAAVAVVLAVLAGCDGALVFPSAPATAAASGSAADALAALPVQPAAPMTGYSRSAFLPHGWQDPDGNGCDARRDVLARQAVDQPRFAGSHHCVLTATIADPYSGTRLPSTRADVDHVVALADAWTTGAASWTPAQRERLANDPLELVAVASSLNRAKGDADASSWLPPAEAGYRCTYVARQVAVKSRYRLWVTQPEHDMIDAVLRGCPGQQLPVTPR